MECPAVKMEHCPWDAESMREGWDWGTASLVSVSYRVRVCKGGWTIWSAILQEKENDEGDFSPFFFVAPGVSFARMKTDLFWDIHVWLSHSGKHRATFFVFLLLLFFCSFLCPCICPSSADTLPPNRPRIGMRVLFSCCGWCNHLMAVPLLQSLTVEASVWRVLVSLFFFFFCLKVPFSSKESWKTEWSVRISKI